MSAGQEFAKEQFDKMILLLLIVIFLSVMIWSKSGQDFAQRTIDILTGALVGIITGKYMAKSMQSSSSSTQTEGTTLTKTVGVVLFFLLACGTSAGQAPTLQSLYGAGVSYNVNASPSVAGTALFAHQIGSSGTYAFTAVDALPNTMKPYTITTNVGMGIAQKVLSIGKIPFFMPTAADISWNGANTGWGWNGGVLALIHLKNQYYLMPTVRFTKSSVSNGTGYQPIVGVLFGWGQ